MKKRSPSSLRVYYQRKEIDSPRSTEQLNRIFERDKGICQICFEICSREDASRDHIKELKDCFDKDEARSDENVRLAHILCNNLRSNAKQCEVETPRRPNGKRRIVIPITQSLADQLEKWTQHNLIHESD